MKDVNLVLLKRKKRRELFKKHQKKNLLKKFAKEKRKM